jgi:hypothetical protein
LSTYFDHYNPGCIRPDYLSAEQSALESDIQRVNALISSTNSGINTNINLVSRFQVKSKKKRQRSGKKVVYRRVTKFSNRELVDGVHFTEKQKKICFGLIVNTAIRELTIVSSRSDSHRLQSRPVGAGHFPGSAQSSDVDEDIPELERIPSYEDIPELERIPCCEEESTQDESDDDSGNFKRRNRSRIGH